MTEKKQIKCEKCGYTKEIESQESSSEFHNKLGITLCNVCTRFAPDDPVKLDEYIEEKVNSSELKPFRKYARFRGDNQKSGMLKRASSGHLVSRVPFGYKLEKGEMIPDVNYKEVEDIFEEFLNQNLSLRQLAKKHQFSVNGIKKILRNFTYIGKIKFNNQFYQGNHQPIISTTLFNHVQNKLEKLGIKRA